MKTTLAPLFRQESAQMFLIFLLAGMIVTQSVMKVWLSDWQVYQPGNLFPEMVREGTSVAAPTQHFEFKNAGKVRGLHGGPRDAALDLHLSAPAAYRTFEAASGLQRSSQDQCALTWESYSPQACLTTFNCSTGYGAPRVGIEQPRRLGGCLSPSHVSFAAPPPVYAFRFAGPL